MPSVTQPAIRPECPALLERVMTEPFYAPHQLAELQEGYYAVNRTYEQLLGEYLSLRLAGEAADEYARHGFVRRLGTVKRCTGTRTGRPMIAVLAASPT